MCALCASTLLKMNSGVRPTSTGDGADGAAVYLSDRLSGSNEAKRETGGRVSIHKAEQPQTQQQGNTEEGPAHKVTNYQSGIRPVDR